MRWVFADIHSSVVFTLLYTDTRSDMDTFWCTDECPRRQGLLYILSKQTWYITTLPDKQEVARIVILCTYWKSSHLAYDIVLTSVQSEEHLIVQTSEFWHWIVHICWCKTCYPRPHLFHSVDKYIWLLQKMFINLTKFTAYVCSLYGVIIWWRSFHVFYWF